MIEFDIEQYFNLLIERLNHKQKIKVSDVILRASLVHEVGVNDYKIVFIKEKNKSTTPRKLKDLYDLLARATPESMERISAVMADPNIDFEETTSG